jgi:multidrug resistance efflux pump
VNKHSGKWFAGVAAIVLLAIAGAGGTLLWKAAHRPKELPKPKAAAVTPLGDSISLPGVIRAQKVVSIAVPVDGKIDAFYVEPGQEVYEGQLLAQIKSEALEAEQVGAQEAMERAQSRLADLEAALIAARLEASRARADASRARSELDRAEKAYARQKMLLSAGATPRITYEKAEREYQAGQVEADGLETVAKQAESRVDSIVKDLDTARKNVSEKTEAAESAKSQLVAGEIHAIVDGVVTARQGSPGDDVNRSMKDLFQIATDLTQLEVVVEPPPPALARIQKEQPAAIRLAEVPGEAIPGIVKKIENGQITIEFASPAPVVKPGLTAQVVLKLT